MFNKIKLRFKNALKTNFIYTDGYDANELAELLQ